MEQMRIGNPIINLKLTKEMKKIFVLMAALVAALGVTSCSNDVEEVIESNKEIKLNITVSGIDGGDETRALKSNWEAGDLIMIWYKAVVTSTTSEYPDMVIKYDGSKWVTATEKTKSGKSPDASGELYAAYMSTYPRLMQLIADAYHPDPWVSYKPFSNFGGIKPMPLTVATPIGQSIPYTYTDGVLTANINKWEYRTKLKVLVKNDNGLMNSDYDLFTLGLTSTDSNSSNQKPIAYSGITWDGDMIANGSGTNGFTGAVEESDGFAFYFGSWDTTGDITFQLKEYVPAQSREFSKAKVVTGKTITTSATSLKCITVKYSEFAE